MTLLQILIRERESKWDKKVASTSEKFTAVNALSSSAFRLALGDLVNQELEIRIKLFIKHCVDQKIFGEFFKSQKDSLLSNLTSRFGGGGIPGEEKFKLMEEKYREILSLNQPSPPKNPIGF